MKKLLLILLLLPCFAGAQTFLVSPDGNIPHDSLTMYVTPTQLADSLAGSGGGADTNALTTNTPMSSTLDTVQRNGVNSALHLSTVGMKMLSNGFGVFTDSTTALRLVNSTPATIGTPEQYSPMLTLEGTGLGGVTSQTVKYDMYTATAPGGTNTTGNLVFTSQVANGTRDIGMFLSTSKQLTVDSNIIITDGQFKTTGTIAQNIGNWHGIENDNGFTSTGASIFSGYSYHGAINQGGGGSGITRGIYVNAGLTSPADYRAIETTNSLGKSIVTGTAPSTFGGNVTFPTFTLGATAITATGTELNYLSGVTSGIQTQLNAKQSTITFGTGVQTALGVNIGSAGAPVLFNGAGGTPSSMTGTNITGIPQSGVTNLASDLALKAPLASPTFTGTVSIPTPFTLGGVSMTSTAAQLNYLNSATGTTGTGRVAFQTSPSFITPTLGVASATSLNTGTTLNGVIFAKSTTAVSLASTAHALTVGNEATGVNMAIGLYSSYSAIQARSNGSTSTLGLQPLGSLLLYGDGSITGSRLFITTNSGSGTADFAGWEVRNGTTNSGEALVGYTLGTAFTTSGMNVQDAGILRTGTALSGGLSIGTQASADMRFYSNNTHWYTLLSGGDFVGVSTGGFGYGTGAGGVVTQATSKATGCTLNELSGQITMNGAALAAATIVTFTFTNNTIDATDVMILNHTTTGTLGAYTLNAQCNAGTATISVRNNTAGSLSEAIVIRYAVIKASNN